jgi:beta-lactam-binding protein with PASTA domain
MTSSLGRPGTEHPGEEPRREAGAARAIAPDLIGLALHEACEKAAWSGTRIDARSVARAHGPWGIVVAQSPSPATRLESAWRIHVLVSVPLPTGEQDDEHHGA